MTNEEAKVFLDNLKICIEEHPVVADWLVEIADRKDTADTPQTDCYITEDRDTQVLDAWQVKCQKTPQTTSTPYCVDTSSVCKVDTPQTDCPWK